jgi:hypothetical protein
MKKHILIQLFFGILFLGSSFIIMDFPSGIDKIEAQKMFIYLQDLRQKKTPKSDKLNRYVKSKRPILHWNDTLAKVAEARVTDMALNDYFDHVDPKGNAVNYYINKAGYKLERTWLEVRSDNYFESLQAGHSNAKEVIADLIIDDGIPSKGHRKHLLGLDSWNELNTDIGIAFYRPDEDMPRMYKTYTVIIIARHKW